jgi:hypothetical protein
MDYLGPERLIALVLFSLLHWVLAAMLLNDLARRSKVRGGKKASWVLAIIFIIYLGSLAYLVCHPDIFYGTDEEQ